MPRGATARKTRSARRAGGAGGVRKAPDVTGLAAIPDQYRQAVLAALTEAGVEDAPTEMATVYDLSTERSLAERAFIAATISAGYREVRRASWPSEAELGDHGEVLHRDDRSGAYRLDDGTVVYAGIEHGWFHARVASGSRNAAAAALSVFARAYPPLYQATDAGLVPITFWSYSKKWGPQSRLRMIEAAGWEAIERNYTASVQAELARMVTGFEPGKDGQLLLWQGSPGTGKTWALRALAAEWRSWAEFHYITDPDAFFGEHPDYMIDVLLADSYDVLEPDSDSVVSESRDGKWRILILEDTGELLAANAKEQSGQGLSRFLNVVDGMVGQGLKVLALVTTNDELGELHPAAVRPGRCASQVAFEPLSAGEANDWLTAEGLDSRLAPASDPLTIAELYARAGSESEAFAELQTGDCECGHPGDDHEGGTGGCGMCDCEAYDEESQSDSETAAIQPVLVPIVLRPNDDGTYSGVVPDDLHVGEGRFEFSGGQVLFTAIPDELAEVLDEIEPSETLPPRTPSPVAPASELPPPGVKRWQATFAPEGVLTDDGRAFAPGALTWRDLPLSLSAMTATDDGHKGAEVAGRIDRIWREGNLVLAEGEFAATEYGEEIAGMVDRRELRGLSVDIAIRRMDAVPLSDVVDSDGTWIYEPGAEADSPDAVELLLGEEQEYVYVVLDGVIGMATVCPFPAFADAEIALVADAKWRLTFQGAFIITEEKAEDDEAEVGQEEGLTAAAAGLAPTAPPADWFRNPEFSERTPLTVGDDGRVYGHAAPWGVCHIGVAGACIFAPRTKTGYAYFHMGEVVCDDGSRVACGTITLNVGHANRNLGRLDTTRHYDDTGTVAAHVVVGEDDHGIWVAGALHSEVDADKARLLRGAKLSGDWRNVDDNLELVALLAVNVPGFPVPRTRALLAAGDGGMQVLSLTSAGFEPTEMGRVEWEKLAAQANGGFAELGRRARAA